MGSRPSPAEVPALSTTPLSSVTAARTAASQDPTCSQFAASVTLQAKMACDEHEHHPDSNLSDLI